MARIKIFLKDELLMRIDAEAAELRVTRGTLIQDALSTFLESRRREREESRARWEMDEAGRGMDALAEKLGAWNPARVIREFRDSR